MSATSKTGRESVHRGWVHRALVSVYDKSGVASFARALVEEFGVEVLSTGGTARLLAEEGVAVTPVEQVTGCGEMLDGRVKTLHPAVHGAILANRSDADHMRQLAASGIAPIDMVVVNLYPFEETISREGCTFAEAIEMIDIGGPCMLRAAAKNHAHVLVVTSARQYGIVLDAMRTIEKDEDWRELRRTLAREAFALTAGYDARVSAWLAGLEGAEGPSAVALSMVSRGSLRYGENPHQEARLFAEVSRPAEATLVPGADELRRETWSFNNYVDGDAALSLGKELVRADASSSAVDWPFAAAFIKHTNPCGCGVAGDGVEAYRRAYLGDPNAAMGGILVCGFPVTMEVAEAVMGTYDRWGRSVGAGGFFVEVWMAPSFEGEAVEHIRSAKAWGQRVRLVGVGDLGRTPDDSARDFKRIFGGMLSQSRDGLGIEDGVWKVATKRRPSAQEWDDLRLAWLVCKHTKSNAVTICKEGSLLGNGAGQMSRVMSCRIATWLAKENGHGESLMGSSAASDAFFPFPDGPEILIEAGVRAIIQPGGSKRDDETVALCDERGVAMVVTGTRHFRH